MTKSRIIGQFGVERFQHDLFGEIELAGRETKFKLIGTKLEHISRTKTFFGRTERSENISCIGCVSSGVARYHYSGNPTTQSVSFFPHYVVVGAKHLAPDDQEIKGVRFICTDMYALFNDYNAIGSIFDAKDKLKNLIDSEDSAVIVGSNSIISYFSGDFKSFTVETKIGQFEALNIISAGNSRPFSHSLELSLIFDSPINLQECVNRLQTIRAFLSVLAGRQQSIENVKIEVLSDNAFDFRKTVSMDVHWSFAPDGEKSTYDKDRREHDMPLHGIRDREAFGVLIANWLSRASEWRQAHRRYIECLEKGNRFPVDRLVAAANMFDLLPSSAVPQDTPVTKDLQDAVAEAKAAFKKLPKSVERESVLSSLGRVGKASLPHKAYYRADIVLTSLGHRLPHLKDVLKVAIQCRNYYVHGSKFDIERFEKYFVFMVLTLEFVFAASDLIDAGWKANPWSHGNMFGNHKFSSFLAEYKDRINSFVKVVNGDG